MFSFLNILSALARYLDQFRVLVGVVCAVHVRHTEQCAVIWQAAADAAVQAATEQ
jgi:hypothetical protein